MVTILTTAMTSRLALFWVAFTIQKASAFAYHGGCARGTGQKRKTQTYWCMPSCAAPTPPVVALGIHNKEWYPVAAMKELPEGVVMHRDTDWRGEPAELCGRCAKPARMKQNAKQIETLESMNNKGDPTTSTMCAPYTPYSLAPIEQRRTAFALLPVEATELEEAMHASCSTAAGTAA